MRLIMNRQALFALFLIVLNTVYFVDVFKLPVPFLLGEPGPAFLPIILSVTLFVACGRILYGELRGAGESEDEEADQAAGSTQLARPVILAIATGAYIFLFEPLGYWIATVLYTFAVAAVFQFERDTRLLKIVAMSSCLAVAITVSGWLFFVYLFDLSLPSGYF